MKVSFYDVKIFFTLLSLAVCLFSCSPRLTPESSLQEGLLVYYPFSGNAQDESGNGHHGKVFGATLGSDKDGKKNSSYSFDGANDYIELGDILDDLNYPFTVSVWVRPVKHTGMYNTIFTAQDNSPLYNGFELHIRNGNSIGIIIGDGRGENSGAYSRSKSAEINDRTGKWTHVAAIVNSNDEMKLYLNGVEVSGNYAGYTKQPMNSNFPQDVARIGRWTSNGNTYYFTGQVDEFRVWDRAITEAEILQLLK